MESLIGTIVAALQLLLAGFVMWGGWLVVKERFPGRRADAAAANPDAKAAPLSTPAHDFERVASLVLLALFCTTLAAAA
jgi:hypothetical protein